MNTKIKYMDIKDFRKEGYLQEVNRLFFHPLGLALETAIQEDGTEILSGIWDYRDDPEGIFYGSINKEKSLNIKKEVEKREASRRNMLGYVIQPYED